MPGGHVCIHGHFYQPPRDNPWTGEVDPQASAAPHRDWNVRITEECYRPNTAARIDGGADEPARTLNNYSRMSFNFGPTLLTWLETHASDVYRSILDADRSSREWFDGHGSAMAQVFNHMIMPLASARDRRSQVVWGLRDFEHRFGRRPEGMWLPETAVDLATLEALANERIAFTILAPHQAARVRARGDTRWRDVTEESLDCSAPYEQVLPSGRRIALFFYDGAISRGVAFEGLLDDGRRFVDRLTAPLREASDTARLVHIATDGESYGHHHKFGEMALAYALDRLGTDAPVRLTNYGAFLAGHPPAREVEIAEATSWSCAHGVERWRRDCGCGSDREGWNQQWREPLRDAFDWLRDRLAEAYETGAADLVRDPWEARDAYIDVLLDPSEPSRRRFLAAHAKPAAGGGRDRLWRLLELQRFSMLMYTSCGWFFEDLARIEPLQVLRYAGRAVELARELGFDDPEPGLLTRLEGARSNRASRATARDLYRRHVTERQPVDEPSDHS